ncbi:MAG: PilZ domain-containing protein [Desulfobacterales bacterium]|nr:PilZ domain-containing protein [Desulfobacterales bacterium]
MEESQSQERREYVRAPLFVDVEFAVVSRDEYEAVRQSEQQARRRAIFSFDQGGQHEADSSFYSGMVDFLIDIDHKLDRMLRLMSRLSGLESPAYSDDKGKGDEVFFAGQGLDISGAGMGIICDKALEEGQIIKANFMIPRFPVIPLVVFGEVVRVAPVQEGGRQRFNVFLGFIDLDEEDREKIISYTFQVQRDTIRKEKKNNNT